MLNLKTDIITTLNETKHLIVHVRNTECNKRKPVRALASYIRDSMISSPTFFFGIHRSTVRSRFFACNRGAKVLHRRRDFIFSGMSPPLSPACYLSQVGRANCAVAIETNVGKPCSESS